MKRGRRWSCISEGYNVYEAGYEMELRAISAVRSCTPCVVFARSLLTMYISLFGTAETTALLFGVLRN